MKERILDEIIKNNKITYKSLLSKFNIGHNELNKILLELKLDGKILQTSNKYSVFPKDLFIGNIAISSSGRKYILHERETISISSNFLNEIEL